MGNINEKKRGTVLNVLFIGAHPDDCEYYAGGTARKFIEGGHRVKFVSATNGDAGHMSLGGSDLTRIRREEMRRADDILGITGFEILDIHDGEIMPTLGNRKQLIRIIRSWCADLVVSHRPVDYHPDHRYTGMLVQDTAYQVIVPNICPETPPLVKSPVYLYMEDTFTVPHPFRPDVIVPVDDVFGLKVDALHEMKSQFYEWLPWTYGTLGDIPEGDAERRDYLERELRIRMKNNFMAETRALYGNLADGIEMVEVFQVCEYGGEKGLRITPGELRSLFQFLPEFVA